MPLHRYLVVEFLVLPYEDIDHYVCVPESWQRWQDPDGCIYIAYPEDKPGMTSIRAQNYEDHSKRWKIYRAKMCYREDSYKDALNRISRIEKHTKGYLNKRRENPEKDSTQSIISTPKSNSIKSETIYNTPSTSSPKTVQKDTEEMTPSKIEKPSPSLAGNEKRKLAQELYNQESGNKKIKFEMLPKIPPFKIPEDFNPERDMFRHNLREILSVDVVELIPKSKVFIDKNVLQTNFNNYSAMVKGLMKGIFTDQALKNCTVTGKGARPGINQVARKAIVKYVYENKINSFNNLKEAQNDIEEAMRLVLSDSRKFKPEK